LEVCESKKGQQHRIIKMLMNSRMNYDSIAYKANEKYNPFSVLKIDMDDVTSFNSNLVPSHLIISLLLASPMAQQTKQKP
jgi:hypothetical protein